MYPTTCVEHIERLGQVFNWLYFTFKIKPAKCQLFRKKFTLWVMWSAKGMLRMKLDLYKGSRVIIVALLKATLKLHSPSKPHAWSITQEEEEEVRKFLRREQDEEESCNWIHKLYKQLI